MKSDIEIKDDIFEHIQSSGLMEHLSGTLEKTVRPKGSDREDVVISILANDVDRDRGVQEAFVNVNIYVADIDVDGQMQENDPRLREVCRLSEEILDTGGIGKDYTFHLDKQRVHGVDDAHEHIVNNKLFYQLTIE